MTLIGHDTRIDSPFLADRADVAPGSAADVVLRFLEAMAHGDVDTTLSLIDDEVVYSNVSLPTIRGRDAFERGARSFFRYGAGFEVTVHRVVYRGATVLTERTDALTFGPWRAQFWVCGVFEVSDDGHVTLWRDYFDWVNVTRGILRGVVGMVMPAFRSRLPAV